MFLEVFFNCAVQIMCFVLSFEISVCVSPCLLLVVNSGLNLESPFICCFIINCGEASKYSTWISIQKMVKF